MIPTRMVKASLAIAGLGLEHADGPREGRVAELNLRVPGHYILELRDQSYFVHLRDQSYFVQFAVDVDEYGRARLSLAEQRLPDPGGSLSPLERELLDGLARIIAGDMLRQREVARC